MNSFRKHFIHYIVAIMLKVFPQQHSAYPNYVNVKFVVIWQNTRKIVHISINIQRKHAIIFLSVHFREEPNVGCIFKWAGTFIHYTHQMLCYTTLSIYQKKTRHTLSVHEWYNVLQGVFFEVIFSSIDLKILFIRLNKMCTMETIANQLMKFQPEKKSEKEIMMMMMLEQKMKPWIGDQAFTFVIRKISIVPQLRLISKYIWE